MDIAVNFMRFMAIRNDKTGGRGSEDPRSFPPRPIGCLKKIQANGVRENSLSLKPYFRGTPMTD